jgi:tetratricopeptide (TPR) repeat protein
LWPDFPAALNNRGAAHEALGNEEDALEDYLAALDIDPRFAVAWYNTARLYARLDEINLCLEYLDQAVQLAPHFAEEAAEDDNLGWVLELNELKQNRPSRN